MSNDTTDPHELPGADPETGNRDIDPVTGFDTTGHEWAGITELNTPFPRIALWALILTFLYSVAAWVLLPAWPTGGSYTRGLLKVTQEGQALNRFELIEAGREDWVTRFAGEPDFDALAQDPALMALAMPSAHRLFGDNCAACHGESGEGGPGFPVLADDYWLWGGDPETVAETIRVGINSSHPDSRMAEMPSFDWMERPERMELARWVSRLPSGKARWDGAEAEAFEDNCASCHGDDAAGGMDNGAPSLVDGSVIYGQDPATVLQTISRGRHGVMPAWSGRLSDTQINMLALYVSTLNQRAGTGGDGSREVAAQ